MFNHVRTLLFNAPGGAPPPSGYPGEEAVDPRFAPVALPTPLLSARAVLFGAAPDRHMLNYRCRQFAGVLHSSPALLEFVTALDARITYGSPPQETAFFSDTLFRPVVTPASDFGTLTVVGTPSVSAADASGQIHHRLLVSIVTPGVLAVERLTPPLQQTSTDLVMLDGLSGPPVALPGTGYSCLVNTDAVGAGWLVEINNRPAATLESLLAACASLGEPTLLVLFGTGTAGTFATFRALFDDRRLPVVLRLGGFLLALAYRTEDFRLLGRRDQA